MATEHDEADAFHLGQGWFRPWCTAYLTPGVTTLAIDRLPIVEDRATLGLLRYHRRRGQTNVHTPRFDLPGTAPVAADLPDRLLGNHIDLAEIEYLPAESRLLAAARAWNPRRVTIAPHAVAPVVDCRVRYEDWLAMRGKRARGTWPKLQAQLTGEMAMTFAVSDGSAGLAALLDEILTVEQSGWKGRAGTAIRDSAADTRFYTDLAHEAAATGALRIATLRKDGRIAAFEYGIIGGNRIFLLKVGYHEDYHRLSIGNILASLHIRHCCADPHIAWYDKLGNGMTPAAYKMRFTETVDTLYRVTLYADNWRGRMLQLHHAARASAKRARDRWRARWAPQ